MGIKKGPNAIGKTYTFPCFFVYGDIGHVTSPG